MIKKISTILLMCMMILAVSGIVSAADWDNKLTYKNEDKTAVVENIFGLGELLGEAELKSHKNVAEVLSFIRGEDRVVMYYEFDKWKKYENGLGEVYFTEVRTGAEIEKEYYFAEAIYETKQRANYKQACEETTLSNGSNLDVCESVIIGYTPYEEIVRWDRLDTNDIPEKKVTIGLVVDVLENEHLDGIWTIAGKKVEKHAEWSEGLNTDIMMYYKFNDTSSPATESVRGLDGTGTMDFGESGIIGTGIFSGASTQWINVTDNATYMRWEQFTINCWANFSTIGQYHMLVTKTTDGGGAQSQLEFRIDNDNKILLAGTGGTGFKTNDVITADKWIMVTAVNTGGSGGSIAEIYINGTNQTLVGSSVSFDDNTRPLRFGTRDDVGAGDDLQGGLDECGIWNRTLSQAEITQLYNSGAGITYTTQFNELSVELNDPVDYFNSTLSPVTFNCSSTDDKGVVNLTLIINDVNNFTITNSSAGENLSIQTTQNLADGDYNWTCEASDGTGLSGDPDIATVRFLNVNTTPSIQLVDPTLADNTNISYNSIPANVSLTETYFDNITIFLSTDAGINQSVNYDDGTRFYNFTNLPDDTYILNATVWTTTGQSNSTASRTYMIDATAPVINLTQPTPIITHQKTGTNLSVNWTLSEAHLDTCLLEYAGVNITVVCWENGTYVNTTGTSDVTVTLWANDTFGNGASDTNTWTYKIFEEGGAFNTVTTEGATEDFEINITIDSTYRLSTAKLIYNNSYNAGTWVQTGDNFVISESLSIEEITANANMTFFWEILLDDATTVNLTSNEQSVLAISVDDCGANTKVLYNFSIVDEATQILLVPNVSNTTAELNLQVYTLNRVTKLVDFSNDYGRNNTFSVCMGTNLSNSEEYSLDLQVQYGAYTYQKELYHIQNNTLNIDDFTTAITLFDLINTSAQVFKINYKDEVFSPVGDALIQVQRKYISEGVFKAVEIVKTDSDGQTVANLIRDEVIYTFLVTKFGKVLATFTDVIATCENQILDDCEINLRSVTSHIEPTDFTTLDDFSYLPTYNVTTRLLTTVFTVPSGSASTVVLNATMFDNLGSTQACSDTLTSSSGTLSCTIPKNFGNGTLIVIINKDGGEAGRAFISMNQKSSEIYGASLVFLALFLMLTIIGAGVSDSPMVTGFFLIIGVILNIVLNIVDSTGFIGKGATVLWILVAIFLVMYKGSKR